MTYERQKRKFKYESIAEGIQKKIQSGEYCADEKLPQEMELCRQYDAARITIREKAAADAAGDC
ncbi:MAG: GntR family transcriptional regulator [Lachnospiraceae bacterium]|nr:GntR family transcriptional regulator [Lachnospiraceae bacterium]